MARPKSSPEHAEAEKVKRREYKRLWMKERRARLAAKREAAGKPKPKRGRPRKNPPDALGWFLTLGQKVLTSFNGISSEKYKKEGKPGLTPKELAKALKQDGGDAVKDNTVAQRICRTKKAGLKKST